MIEQIITFHFSAAHCLEDHKGKCKNDHGHNYKVEAITKGKFTPEQIKALEKITSNLDNSYLNDILGRNPTAERVAKHYYDSVPAISNVTVWENENSASSYYE